MPPKTKASSKAPNPEPRAAPESPPDTIAQRSQQRFFQTNPVENRRQQVGLSALTPAEKKTYAHVNLIHPAVNRRVPFSNKTEREFWKFVTKEGLPIRRLPRDYAWGKDRSGRDIGTYSPNELEQRTLKHAKLTSLQIQHRQFLKKREKQLEVTTEEIAAEKTRRKAMAALKRDLYGEITGSLAQDPDWDDVIPIPQNEPEGALAQIAYPDDYAEGTSV
ncbi:hypothetical protein LB505_005372 [Fusarium chuoi]|nr:hypothetical protein LB505_005372 [Fusarium chuoi]